MAIQTSYYDNSQVSNPVAISSRPPEGYTGNWYKKLAPPVNPNIVVRYKKGTITQEQYVEMYTEMVLNQLDCQAVYNEILELYGNDATLLCYELPGEFCHRHLVSEWFNKNLKLDQPVEEHPC